MAKQKTQFIMDEELSKKVEEIRAAKGYAKSWGDIADVKRSELMEEVPEGESVELVEGASGVALASILEVQSKRFDMARFKKDHPELDLDKYYVASLSRQLRF